MTKKHIITIAGRPGSGKSTTAKMVAKKLGFEHFSSGDLFRQLAKEQGIDLLQANFSAEKNSAVDNLIDERLRQMGAQRDRMVVDSRMAWHWMPFSFKVFLDLDLTVAAERILNDTNQNRQLANEKVKTDPVKYAKMLRQRLDSEARRYETLYQVNPYDKSNYDLVVDTAANDIEKAINLVIQNFQAWISQKP